MKTPKQDAEATGATTAKRENPSTGFGYILSEGLAEAIAKDSSSAAAVPEKGQPHNDSVAKDIDFNDHMKPGGLPGMTPGDEEQEDITTTLRSPHSSGCDIAQQGTTESRSSSGKKRMLMTFSSDEEEVRVVKIATASRRRPQSQISMMLIASLPFFVNRQKSLRNPQSE